METLAEIIAADWKDARRDMKKRTANLTLESLSVLVEGIKDIQPVNTNMTDTEHAAWLVEGNAELHEDMTRMGNLTK